MTLARLVPVSAQHLVGEESPQISEIVELEFWIGQKKWERGIGRGFGYGLNEVCPE